MGEEMTNKNDFTRKLEKKLPTPPSTVKGTNSSTPIKVVHYTLALLESNLNVSNFINTVPSEEKNPLGC